MIYFTLFLSFILQILSLKSKSWEDKCTTIAIGRKATIDGSTVSTDTMVIINYFLLPFLLLFLYFSS